MGGILLGNNNIDHDKRPERDRGVGSRRLREVARCAVVACRCRTGQLVLCGSPQISRDLHFCGLEWRALGSLQTPMNGHTSNTYFEIAGVLQSGEDITCAVLANATFKGAALISALSMLTNVLATPPQTDQTARAPAIVTWDDSRRNLQFSFGYSDPLSVRQALFDWLAPLFEALHHGRRYAVSKYPSGGDGIRVTRSTGPAVTWTRELFRLLRDRHSAPPELAHAISDFMLGLSTSPKGLQSA